MDVFDIQPGCDSRYTAKVATIRHDHALASRTDGEEPIRGYPSGGSLPFSKTRPVMHIKRGDVRGCVRRGFWKSYSCPESTLKISVWVLDCHAGIISCVKFHLLRWSGFCRVIGNFSPYILSTNFAKGSMLRSTMWVNPLCSPTSILSAQAPLIPREHITFIVPEYRILRAKHTHRKYNKNNGSHLCLFHRVPNFLRVRLSPRISGDRTRLPGILARSLNSEA